MDEALLGERGIQARASRSLMDSKRPRIFTVLGVLVAAVSTIAIVVLGVKIIDARDSLAPSPIRSLASAGGGQICEADNGVVASDDERCSIVGRDALARGGHAVDAAVATAVCEGVVNPMSSGIGGGAFLLLRLANGSAIAYDMRETAPAAASKDMYAKNPSSKVDGALSAGVPGELAGLHLAWQHFGRLPWKSLFEPAIKLARDGFVVTAYLEFEIAQSLKGILAHRTLRQFLSPNGKLVKAGDVLRNEELARTLELIANEGPGVLYGGVIGEKLAADVQAAGGIITIDDLRDYETAVREAVTSDVMGLTVLGMPPPSSGGATLALVFNILSNFDDLASVPDDLFYHRLVEAFKHAYAVRMNLGDPGFANISRVMQDMLSPDFAVKLYTSILDNTTFGPEHYGSKWNQLVDHGTCHFGIIDQDRNALSMTTTVNWRFGSMLLSKSTGILLNNEMNDFAVPKAVVRGEFPPAEVNFVAPNKRPLSSMSPTIVLQDGQLRAVLGASGGIKIITGVAQVFLNYFVRGKDALHSVTTPRVHHQLVPNEVECEDWTLVTNELVEVPEVIRDGLSARQHKVVETTGYCVTQLVLHDLHVPAINHKPSLNNSTVYFGRITGVSDYRKHGSPAGF
ncbi:glutathione hydrolase 2 [Selaginella moellendorffii]|uniref:glutathione hydrolase 2 n=1 Tax=Selaginella moellendorffii TaxID=88036 RepID=UPI000D1C2915|nr:glutathione hydrolase 2 [Selaginella moellendorffii]|eukprot:XP_024540946.1 glutathione hydrolase 2 [Selaginella moellendorffii]